MHFDQHPTTFRRLPERITPPVELDTVFDGEWHIELWCNGVLLRLTPAECNQLGGALIGVAARVAALNAETQAGPTIRS